MKIQSTKSVAMDILDCLPLDIVEKIYRDHFRVELLYHRVMKCFNDRRTSYMSCNDILVRHMKRILNDPELMAYMVVRSESFRMLYEKYIKFNSPYWNWEDTDRAYMCTWIYIQYH